MRHEKFTVNGKSVDGYEIPIGPVKLVNVVSDKGMIGCGAFDVAALDKFSYPAARVKGKEGKSIGSVEDLLGAVIREANQHATKLGVVPDMPVEEALKLL